MEAQAKLMQDIHEAKRDRILDLIGRAAANGTYKEVAGVIARDWMPLVSVTPNGDIEIKVQ